MSRQWILFLFVTSAMITSETAGAQKLTYPATRPGDVAEVLHGTRVPDPYRWLEDTNSAETAEWVTAQNRMTFGWLERLPARDTLRQRLTELWNFERFGVPDKEAGLYVFARNTGLQNQSVLYIQRGPAAEPRELLDPNRLSDDGTVALAVTSLAPDGRHFAYATASGGSDWNEIHVRDVATLRDLPDIVRWAKFSFISWTKDGKGFFYARFPEPKGDQLLSENRNHAVYYHALGTAQERDVLIYERPDQPDWFMGTQVSEDGRYLVIYNYRGTDPKNGLYYVDLGDPAAPDVTAPIVRLLDHFDAQYTFLGSDGEVFYLQTDNAAPRRRIIAIDTRDPAPARWRTVVPEAKDVIESSIIAGDRLVLAYLEDAKSRVRLFRLDGHPAGEVPLPGIGYATEFSGRRGDSELFFAFSSFLAPAAVYRYDVSASRIEVHRAPTLTFDTAAYETRQVFYTSKDGTRVPMFITHRKGIELDASHPTLLYAYGGFNISLTPFFSPAYAVWLEQGGVLAVANLRGGGEYGEQWHLAGTLERKQNVFDDFIAGAEYLIEQRWTSPERLAIQGSSNGGLLVGATMTQRPDLFAVALPDVGVLDMLRFHKFTIGWAWASDYGSADDANAFRWLRAYSPLHNIKPGTCYPATIVTTADHDDRVVPGHSFKFAAALQSAQSCERPTLIRIETRAGHGAGKPVSKQIEEAADVWAFTLANMRLGKPRTD
jgi:prolyl oligopeptidase